ncbi:hypothetical protein Tco_1140922 [Tanacetum coccineum]
MSSPNRSTSNIEDAFSSMNILNYTSASPDYFPASAGSSSFNSLENPKENMNLPVFSSFYNNPCLKDCALSLDKLAMPPHLHKKFRMGVAIPKGCRGYYKPGTRAWVRRGSRKIRIPIDMYPCRVEERLTIKLVKGEVVLKIETTVTAKYCTITKFPGKFPEYKPTKEEEEISKLNATCKNVIYDISNSDSDIESTARSGPRDNEMEDTGVVKFESMLDFPLLYVF